jgi:dTDP-4-amino-4,6-dideoxygalactose transaminase
VGRHYPFVCPEQPAVEGIGVTLGPLTNARRLAERELSLPLHPYLQDDEVEAVIEACLKVCG